ncbi:MAG: hypothetical protein HKM04_00610 [Legionellales bacterium]|nr:hypothetical protein [Legionellales bacterium]
MILFKKITLKPTSNEQLALQFWFEEGADVKQATKDIKDVFSPNNVTVFAEQ